MEITQHHRSGHVELELSGRLDANWADHVGGAVELCVRAGHHQINLNLARVEYVSSAGIRVLLKHYKQLKAARGLLGIVQPTESVLAVLRLAGIADLLLVKTEVAAPVAKPAGPKRIEMNGVSFEIHDQLPGRTVERSCQGNPERFSSGALDASDCRKLRYTNEMFGLGLGAFGQGFEDCRGRFGEFLAVAGAAIALPTDGSSVPDYQLAEGQLVPEVNALYSLIGSGGFAQLLRFEAGAAPKGVLGLSHLIESALEITGTGAAGFAIVAESAGLVGATLRKSPALAAGAKPWDFPAVRDWISYTTERSDERNMVLIVGFAERTPSAESAAFLRSIGPGATALGHFHAAVFPYRPLPKGNLDLKETVAGLLATESAVTLMHLLADEREFEGVGQTDLMRGACWVGPLNSPATKPKP